MISVFLLFVKPEPENQVDPDTVIALNNSMKQLHKLHIKLKMESKQKIDELKQLIKQVGIPFYVSGSYKLKGIQFITL